MSNIDIIKEISSEETVSVDGFDDAIIGIVERFGDSEIIVLYDKAKVVSILQERDGMTYDDAIDYYHYNIVGSFMGEGTPAFATLNRDLDQ